MLEETRLIKETLTELFSKVFSMPVYFEHGAMSDVCKGGCCSVHAHMHCVAVDVDIVPELKQSELKVKEINNFNEIRNQSSCNKPYLYYENQINKKYLIEVEEIESQFIRKKIGIKMGIVDRLEWSQNIQYQWMIDTIKRVTPFFNNLKGTSIWQ